MPTYAAARRPHGKAVIVVLHGVGWEELAASKVAPLQTLLRQAAVGAMNSRVLGEPGWESAYVTIGAGRAAVGDRGTEGDPPPGFWIAVDGVYDRASTSAAVANRRAHTQAQPGLLGERLAQNGLGASLEVVRADQDSAPTPLPPRERIKERVTGVGGSPSPGPPSAGRPLPERERYWRGASSDADLLVFDLADFLDRPGAVTSPTVPDPQAVALLRAYAPVFADIARAIVPARDLLIIVSPTCPPYRRPNEIAYAPIAIIGPGFGPGLLTSASSRRVGMVSNTDIAPTLLRFFGLQAPPAMSGHVIGRRPAGYSLDRVLGISRRGSRLLDLQWRLGPVYGIWQFITFAGIGAALAFAPRWAKPRRRRLQFALLVSMGLPLALLLLGPLDPGGPISPYLAVAGLAVLLAWLAWVGSPPIMAMGALLSATAALMMLDLVTGRHLLDNYILNYGAYGTRLYGMHNESMGAAVACAVIGGAALAGSRRLLGLWLAAVALIIGAPRWGANWGGGMTAAFAFTVGYLAVRAGRPRLRHWLAAAAAAAAAGCLIVAMDLASGARPSTHMGDAVRLVGVGGWPALWDMIARKAAGSLRILVFAPYSVTAIIVCAGTAWLVFRPPARLRATFEANRAVWGGIAGALAGAIAAVLVNDSGLVAASTAAGIFASAIAFVALQGQP